MRTDQALSVFLVDDDKVFLRTMEHHLQHKLSPDVRIHTFPTGEECLVHMRDKPDIVVLDYFLNDNYPYASNGGEILKSIKRTAPETTVIMLSGQNKMEVALQALNEGAHAYIIKNDNVFFKTVGTIRRSMERIVENKRNKAVRRTLAISFALVLLLGIAALILKGI